MSDSTGIVSVAVSSLSRVQLFVTLWTVARQASLSVRISRQGNWSGFPFPSLEDLPRSGIEPTSAALANGFFTAEQTAVE